MDVPRLPEPGDFSLTVEDVERLSGFWIAPHDSSDPWDSPGGGNLRLEGAPPLRKQLVARLLSPERVVITSALVASAYAAVELLDGFGSWWSLLLPGFFVLPVSAILGALAGMILEGFIIRPTYRMIAKMLVPEFRSYASLRVARQKYAKRRPSTINGGCELLSNSGERWTASSSSEKWPVSIGEQAIR